MNIKYNDKNKTYWFVLSAGTNPITNKRIQLKRKGFKTKKEAREEFSKLQIEHLESSSSSTIQITLSLLLDQYFNYRKTIVKPTTYNSEMGQIKNHILPFFLRAKLSDLTRKSVLSFQQHLQTKSLSNNTINKVLLSLKLIFDFAIENDYMRVNPYVNIKPLKVEKTTMSFWTPNEFKSFITYIENHETFLYKVFYLFAYSTGARMSEILAVTWEDINFDTKVCQINKALNYDKVNRVDYLDTTKTKSSNRTIALPSSLIALLKQLNEQAVSNYVFSTNKIDFPNRRKFQKVFAKNIPLSGVKKIRFHDLRHSHASLLIDMKEQDFLIKERMGHSSIRITYDIYGHLFPTRQHELANRLEEFI